MKVTGRSRGGRPWSFDRTTAVETAMRLFWRHGYEGVSLGDLTRAIGVAPPSLYAAFGSKAELYQAALDHYEKTIGALKPATLEGAMSMADAVRRLLEAALAAVVDPERERGCMISSGMVACHPDHAALARDAAERRAALRRRLVGALRPFANAEEVERLSRHLAAVMQGLSIQARDGASRAELQDIVDDVVAGVAARFPKKRRPG
ncbi:transcriptional regulator [Rhodopseudomonas sp. AAP120]|uniref:TetR/AcrR family transcriptional regulator n=1 Tax=Rhodopseudomonas sp. AAP120 TaxID=1523430 RepID=UPI0006B9D729|nr:TetR/AcrR family transcriptional regulator [Rhodopseudomonas sp. AAP120]KPF99795.1 transcriptional regulator [Rhodopseudomonas sp. AAP120]